MGWAEVKQAYGAFADAVRNGQDGLSAAAWQAFTAVATRGPGDIPYHMRAIFRQLAEIEERMPRAEINILDHGAGGGLTLMYLLANGYRGIHGVDLGGPYAGFNAFFRRHLGLETDRFLIYDGRRLPFSNDMFDLIFSEEVLEHVRPDAIESYYLEERRVMRPGAVAFHRVPHRLTPLEGHTRTWFIHYLPRPIWLAILRRSGRDMTVPETALFLRWPWVHRKFVRRYLGSCEDHTLQRFKGLSDLSHFEGPKELRKLVVRILDIPVIGGLVGIALRNVVMLDTVSRIPDGDGGRQRP